MSLHVAFPQSLAATVALPASKSLSARALIIGALAGGSRIDGLSDCDDTRVLHRALTERPAEVDVQAAGTAMRFSAAYFAATPGEHVLTGTERMRQRPIGILVSALRALGADIDYLGREGCPPLRIKGQRLCGGEVELRGDVSSQYVSALLMIGPVLAGGLRLRLTGEIASRPYIDMTLNLMQRFGAAAGWDGADCLRVGQQPYRSGVHYEIEPDWSAASYWYEMVCLSPDAEAAVFLPGLRSDSVQGDRAAARLFEPLGVRTEFLPDGVRLQKSAGCEAGTMEADFTACPDLAQTLVAACAALGRPFRFTGLQSLKIKETDSIAALQTELKKLGVTLEATENSLTYDGRTTLRPAATPISTYDDHRMALAFAPLALRLDGGLRIAHSEVVGKSYPAYWDDLRRVGAILTEERKEERP